MSIDRLNPIDPIQNLNKPEKPAKASSASQKDAINLSSEARMRSEILQAAEMARDVPDIRADKVAAVKEKLKDPSYINDAVVDAVADNILSAFGIQ